MDRLTNAQHKKYIIISLVIVVALLVITFAPMLFSNPDSQDAVTSEPEPETESVASEPKSKTTAIPIDGLEKRAENLSSSQIELIEQTLFRMVVANTAQDETPDVTDTTVRDGSYQQTLSDPGKQTYLTTFIVDIPDLKQSYRILDYYSPLPPEMSGLYDIATLVLCPEVNELIYGDFGCIDAIAVERGYEK